MLAQIDVGFKYCRVACEKHCIQREDDSGEDTESGGSEGRRNGQDRSLHLGNVKDKMSM